MSKYKIIPVVGIIATIVAMLWSYNNEIKENSELLMDFDFTGMTTIYLYVIAILNLIILFFYLYLGVRKEEKGFPYIFNKVFAILFLLLFFITILSFIIIRNTEEKIAIEFEENILSVTNTILQIESIEGTRLKKIKEFKSDKFSSVKMNIANEIRTMSTFERYLWIFIYKRQYDYGDLIIPSDEESYYSIFPRFARIDICLCAICIYCMKDKRLQEKSKI